MSKYLLAITLLAISCKTPIPVMPPTDCFTLPQYEDEAWGKWSNRQLSLYFKSMREAELDCYKKFNSDMHIAMRIWRDRLNENDASDVVNLLGQADLVIDSENIAKYNPPRDEVLQIAVQEIPDNPSIRYHIYFWRGWHDYLWFKTEKDKVIKADMYYAYE